MKTWFRLGRATAILGVCLMLVGCAQAKLEARTDDDTQPAQVQAISGTSVNRVILTKEASSNIGIETATVLAQTAAQHAGIQWTGTSTGTYVPMTAIIYDPTGQPWVYTNTANRTFVRAQVAIAQTTGQTAYLDSGPPAGTVIVTIGASELLGAEYGVGGE